MTESLHPPEQMAEDYPASADLARLRRGEVPAGSMIVRLTILVGMLTLLASTVGLFIAWRDADNRADLAAEQLQCPRESAVAFDEALGAGVSLVVALQVELSDALAAVAAQDPTELAAATERLTVLVEASVEVVDGLNTAVQLRQQSLDSCDPSPPPASTQPKE